jgi:hypothetical protein
VNFPEVLEICSSNLIEITTDGSSVAFAVAKIGIDQLMTRTGLNEVELLEIVMTPDSQIDDTTKRQLLFGLLLFRGGLKVIKEDGLIMAPVPEISLGSSDMYVRGEIVFLDEFGPEIPHDPPDLAKFCEMKNVCGGRVRQLIQFLLQKLSTLPVDESLLDFFRVKSYSSMTNKLFYRGKYLTDLFATTVRTDAEFNALKKKLVNEKGAILVDEQYRVNGNGDLTYRFVRILQIQLEGASHHFTFPVYYEVIWTRHMTPICHKIYEWERLESKLGLGQINTLRRGGFTIESLGGSDKIEA